MSVKILLVFICAAVGTAVGFTVMRMYKRNLAYISGVCALIGELKRNIAYRRDGAVNVLQKLTVESSHLRKNIDEFISFVTAKDGKLNLSRGFLPADAYSAVCELFGALGSFDSGTQLGELEFFDVRFGELKDRARTKFDKYGALAVKLGFLFGLGMGILIL